ncbi:Serine acetyltransferase 3, mitochondrial [Apostasia shenzhenica]|uniref:serine O-acetyltransferase n=1 Tax=Apostasia shenzhenica TaxID=1088818 RepID=A0A2I0AWK6_9ASPA|nr:Serine acetyltransferase 3, mitochondrial [Apostasia shenzhenica]
MTSSILSPPVVPDPVRPVAHRIVTRPMATCADSSRAPPPVMTSLSCGTSRPQIDQSVSQWPGFSQFAGLPVPGGDSGEVVDDVWAQIRAEALADVELEPILARYYSDLILRHDSLESALADHLARKLSIPDLLYATDLFNLFAEVLLDDLTIQSAVRADLQAARDRDPACLKMAHCFLYYKGFLACQAHRIAHRFWTIGRRAAALLIQSRSSDVFSVDIHPGAWIGTGVLLDHATGVVIGETAVVGHDVSILHNVTLGGTGKDSGDRHPKIGDGVLIGAGTQILGNVKVGKGAKVGAGSVVLKDVPARTTAVGNPANLIGGKDNPVRLDRLAGLTMDHTSWSDYVI